MLYNDLLLSALKNADNFMLCTHVRPDGDAIGSLLAAGRMLEKMGKRCVLVSADGVPDKMLCLPGAQSVIRPEQVGDAMFDLALAVDVSDEKRMGAALEIFSRAKTTVQIDHHPTNPEYAMHNAVDTQACATGELIAALYEEMHVPLDADTAFQLYCAICSDSGNFCFNSVRPYTFACMEKLMRAGLDIASAARQLFMTHSRAHAAALGRALSSMQYFAQGQATCMHLTREDKIDCGATDEDLHGIVNEGLYLDGVKMTFMADETDEGWKYSLRALPGYDIMDIAASLGGGGHKLAAGCTVNAPYEETAAVIMAAMEKKLQA